MEKQLIVCSFMKKCSNYKKECHHCKWNASCDIDNYLVMKSGGKTLRFLTR